MATFNAARTSLEEQGVNTLFIALGMLKWRDADTSDQYYHAPLVLIPVELDRPNVRERFHLRYNGDDLGDNVSLAEKLKQNFALKFPIFPETEDLNVDEYLDAVASSVRSRSGWSVERDRVVLGFFSFAKFLMYRDLDAATWPKKEMLLEHPLLQRLLGDGSFSSGSSGYDEDSSLDEQLADREVVHVTDADSSQMLALLDVIDGRNMVIQGPPGTGKSQTIVNLIAAALGNGKKVLFVAEKMAALEVVKRRLDAAKLGAACLELHSNKTNKKTVIEELKRTVGGTTSPSPGADGRLAALDDVRNRLNEYCRAVNEPIGTSGETPNTAFGKILAAQEALECDNGPALTLDNVTDWTVAEADRRTRLVHELQDRVARLGPPKAHPFWGSGITIFLPTDRNPLREVIAPGGEATKQFAGATAALAKVFSTAAPSIRSEAGRLLSSAELVIEAPTLSGLNTHAPLWRDRSEAFAPDNRCGKTIARFPAAISIIAEARGLERRRILCPARFV